MDQVKKYRQLTKTVFEGLLAGHYDSMGSIQASLITDEKAGHFLIVQEGWQNNRFIYGTSIHVEVKDNSKVWIHRDSSAVVIIDHLEKAGIPTSTMVVSWHPPVARKHTEFAEG